MEPCPDINTIQRYISGEMDQSEESAFRHHMANCEMCTDAVEGLFMVPDLTVVDELKDQVRQKYSGENKSRVIPFFTPLRAAASVLIMIGLSAFIYLLILEEKDNQLVREEAPVTKSPAPFEQIPPAVDSVSENGNLNDEAEEEEDIVMEPPAPAEPQKLAKDQVILEPERDLVETDNFQNDIPVLQEKSMERIESNRAAEPLQPEPVTQMQQDREEVDNIARSAVRKKERTAQSQKSSVQQSQPAAVPAIDEVSEQGITTESVEDAEIFSNEDRLYLDRDKNLLGYAGNRLRSGDTTAIKILDSLAINANSPIDSEAKLILAEHYLSVGNIKQAQILLNVLDQKDNPCQSMAKQLLRNIK